MKWGIMALGKKPAEMSSSDEADKSEGKSEDFGGAGLGMAVRAFAKALGVDADLVDVPKAVKAFKAASAACASDDSGMEEEEEE